ncbi:BppU family phage baseplate upper protein [Lactococcus lactis]|uniref:BppU family phage baseplate upper protein n=1 Tax=Lactococcus lactis TaxID=1358 RepID=UPI003D1232A7
MTEHFITLSTTEPNNYVGLLKMRQGDINTQTIQATITANGQLFKFDRLSVFFNAVLPNGNVIRDKVTEVDYVNSKLNYVVADSFLQEVAQVTAWFSFENGDKIIDSTKNFQYSVIAGWKESIPQGNYIYELSEIQREIEEIIGNKDFSSLLKKIGLLETNISYLDNTKADKSFVDEQFASIVSGAPKGTFATLAALQTAYPSGTEGVFLILKNGHWYYYASGWKDGGMYQSTGIADGTVTLPKLSSDISGLTKIQMTSGYYITTGVAVGSTVNLSPQQISGWRYAIINCVSGDKFTINGTGGNNGRLWAFLDSNNILLSVAVYPLTATNSVITAPSNAVKLIINDNNTGGICYTGEYRVDTLEAEMNNVNRTLFNTDTINNDDTTGFNPSSITNPFNNSRLYGRKNKYTGYLESLQLKSNGSATVHVYAYTVNEDTLTYEMIKDYGEYTVSGGTNIITIDDDEKILYPNDFIFVMCIGDFYYSKQIMDDTLYQIETDGTLSVSTVVVEYNVTISGVGLVEELRKPESGALHNKNIVVLGDSVMQRMSSNWPDINLNTHTYRGIDGLTYDYSLLSNINGHLYVTSTLSGSAVTDDSISVEVINTKQAKMDSQDWVALKLSLGCKTLHNFGLGSAKVNERDIVTAYPYQESDGRTTSLPNEVRWMLRKYNEGYIPYPDCIIISAGINNAPLGIEDNLSAVMALSYDELISDECYSIRQTFYGGMRYTLETLTRNFENATIFMFGPSQCGWADRPYDKIKDVVKALKNICGRLSVIVYDVADEMGVTQMLETQNGIGGKYLVDGIHPNNAGKVIWTNYYSTQVSRDFYSKKNN